MDGQYVFEEIKKRYKKSNKYMLCVTYEDIRILIQMVDILDKQLKYRKEESNIKLTKEQKENAIKNLIEKHSKEIEELKAINKKLEARKYMYNAETGEVTAIPIDNNYISKAKIKAKIEELKQKKYILSSRESEIEILQSLLEDGGIINVK